MGATLVKPSVDPGGLRLQPPPLRDDLVLRTRLLRRLEGAGSANVVAVIAPAGYGKTTLLSQWAEHRSRPLAWLSAEDADRNPAVLFAAVAAAIDHAVGLDEETRHLLGTRRGDVLSTAVPRLASALHRTARPFTLIIDDVHRFSGSASVDALGLFIGHVPPHVEVVVAGRSSAGLPLARFAASGRLLELTANDLAFAEDESVTAIGRLDTTIGSDGARAIHLAAEGWAAAVYLLTRSRRGSGTGSVRGEAATVPPDGHGLAAYFDEELLRHRDPATMSFLTRTAILTRLTGPLCDAVLGSTGSAAILHQLSADDHLVARLDDAGRWYRYHALLRDHLLAIGERESIDLASCHLRAADWYLEHGAIAAAVEHRFAGADVEGAAAIISAHAVRTFRDGQEATVDGWIGRLDDDALRRHPYVAAAAAWAAVLNGSASRADRMMDLIDSAAYGPSRPSGAESYEVARLLARAVMGRSGIEAAIDDARSAVRGEPPSGEWRSVALAVLGMALAGRGHLDEAERVFLETVEVAVARAGGRAHVMALAYLAEIAAERDEWARAAEQGREAVRLLTYYDLTTDVSVPVVHARAARIAVRTGDLAAARQHLRAVQSASPTLSVAASWISVHALLEASLGHLALSDPSGARTMLRHAEEILARRATGLAPLDERVAALRRRIRGLPSGLGGASTLTAAEIRVLRLLPTYLSVPEIAERLFVSSNTVRTQVQSIYAKLDASSRAEAVERAVDAGLLEVLPVLADGDITTR